MSPAAAGTSPSPDAAQTSVDVLIGFLEESIPSVSISTKESLHSKTQHVCKAIVQNISKVRSLLVQSEFVVQQILQLFEHVRSQSTVSATFCSLVECMGCLLDVLLKHQVALLSQGQAQGSQQLRATREHMPGVFSVLDSLVQMLTGVGEYSYRDSSFFYVCQAVELALQAMHRSCVDLIGCAIVQFDAAGGDLWDYVDRTLKPCILRLLAFAPSEYTNMSSVGDGSEAPPVELDCIHIGALQWLLAYIRILSSSTVQQVRSTSSERWWMVLHQAQSLSKLQQVLPLDVLFQLSKQTMERTLYELQTQSSQLHQVWSAVEFGSSAVSLVQLALNRPIFLSYIVECLLAQIGMPIEGGEQRLVEWTNSAVPSIVHGLVRLYGVPAARAYAEQIDTVVRERGFTRLILVAKRDAAKSRTAGPAVSERRAGAGTGKTISQILEASPQPLSSVLETVDSLVTSFSIETLAEFVMSALKRNLVVEDEELASIESSTAQFVNSLVSSKQFMMGVEGGISLSKRVGPRDISARLAQVQQVNIMGVPTVNKSRLTSLAIQCCSRFLSLDLVELLRSLQPFQLLEFARMLSNLTQHFAVIFLQDSKDVVVSGFFAQSLEFVIQCCTLYPSVPSTFVSDLYVVCVNSEASPPSEIASVQEGDGIPHAVDKFIMPFNQFCASLDLKRCEAYPLYHSTVRVILSRMANALFSSFDVVYEHSEHPLWHGAAEQAQNSDSVALPGMDGEYAANLCVRSICQFFQRLPSLDPELLVSFVSQLSDLWDVANDSDNAYARSCVGDALTTLLETCIVQSIDSQMLSLRLLCHLCTDTRAELREKALNHLTNVMGHVCVHPSYATCGMYVLKYAHRLCTSSLFSALPEREKSSALLELESQDDAKVESEDAAPAQAPLTEADRKKEFLRQLRSRHRLMMQQLLETHKAAVHQEQLAYVTRVLALLMHCCSLPIAADPSLTLLVDVLFAVESKQPNNVSVVLDYVASRVPSIVFAASREFQEPSASFAVLNQIVRLVVRDSARVQSAFSSVDHPVYMLIDCVLKACHTAFQRCVVTVVEATQSQVEAKQLALRFQWHSHIDSLLNSLFTLVDRFPVASGHLIRSLLERDVSSIMNHWDSAEVRRLGANLRAFSLKPLSTVFSQLDQADQHSIIRSLCSRADFHNGALSSSLPDIVSLFTDLHLLPTVNSDATVMRSSMVSISLILRLREDNSLGSEDIGGAAAASSGMEEEDGADQIVSSAPLLIKEVHVSRALKNIVQRARQNSKQGIPKFLLRTMMQSVLVFPTLSSNVMQLVTKLLTRSFKDEDVWKGVLVLITDSRFVGGEGVADVWLHIYTTMGKSRFRQVCRAYSRVLSGSDAEPLRKDDFFGEDAESRLADVNPLLASVLSKARWVRLFEPVRDIVWTHCCEAEA